MVSWQALSPSVSVISFNNNHAGALTSAGFDEAVIQNFAELAL